MASMNNRRTNLLVVANNGKLWAIGGYDTTVEYDYRDRSSGKTAYFSTVEVYDPKKNAWSYGPSLNKISDEVTGGMLSM